MTFSLGQKHDQHYTCQCGQFLASNAPNVSKRHWKCTTCLQSVSIYMDDSVTNPCTVIRHRADDVMVGVDLVYSKGAILTSGEVKQSRRPDGKLRDTHWFLAVLGFGSETIPADQYVNVA
ncbi:hypothetical protein K5D42_25070 [Pseudomonas cichorii]|nr:hypothetical protein [Pseudomonas cichorii]MBX8493145.1 hypothetical protein [Pseudomonas cichorii]